MFYMDIRAGGKNYEEFVRRAIEEDGVNYVRGRVARIYEKNGKLIVKGVDTLLGASPVEIEADMVVLATAGVANKGSGRTGAERCTFLMTLISSLPNLTPN